MDSFVACRTTLDDLQRRMAALGEQFRIGDIAAHLTGKAQFSDAFHAAVIAAMEQRLNELASPAASGPAAKLTSFG
jgi:hypothetical protein